MTSQLASPTNEVMADSLERLRFAARHGDNTLVSALLTDPQLDINGGARHMTPLHEAAWGGHTEVVKLLIEKGADINIGSSYKAPHTPLHTAAEEGHYKVVELLLHKGADVNAGAPRHTPLHKAAAKGRSAVANLLLENGADINAGAPRFTPLGKALERGQFAVVGLLLGRGAKAETGVNVNEVDVNDGAPKSMPLRRVAARRSTSAINPLLGQGANIPHMATALRNTTVINPLLERRPSVGAPLVGERHDIMPDWITCEWEFPPVLSTSFSDPQTLKTTVVITGWDSSFEVTTCEVYLKREWGGIGVELLQLIISNFGDSRLEDGTNSKYIRALSVEPGKIEVLCKSEIPEVEKRSVAAALAWFCEAVRTPSKMRSTPGSLEVSSSTRRITTSPRRDSRVHQSSRIANSSSDIPVLSILLEKLSPLSLSENSCWQPLFNSGVIVLRSSQRKSHQSNGALGKGLELPFDLMVLLACVELPVLVDEGVILMGYRTALVPVRKSGDSIQWHLETSPAQINPYSLQSTQQEWFKTSDWNHFKDKRCFVGWCSSVNINLGTTILTNRVGWSDSKVQERTLRWSGISLGAHAVTTNPFQIGLTGQLTYSFVNHTVTFHPSDNFAKMLKDASMEVTTVVDCLYKRSWLVPKLSLMLHMAHAWAVRYNVDPNLIPFARPHHDGSSAEMVLQGSGGRVLLGQELDSPNSDSLTLRQLLLGLNTNLRQSRDQTMDAKSRKLFGFEFMDIVCEPPSGGKMKRVSIKSQGRCWFDIINKVDAVVVCANLGEAITPAGQDNQRKPDCSTLPSGFDYLAAPLSCLTELVQRQGVQDTDSNNTLNHNPGPSNQNSWRLSGNPFEVCPHDSNSTQTCWDRDNILQKVAPNGFVGDIGGDIPQTGAVVFGRRRLLNVINRFLL
ncbi:MAG: hypothetical protein M1839_005415 [Geoglossum umbratile]|nr:MAG: hypothetical protein M1839_005415 [Geoglossum umbratile]